MSGLVIFFLFFVKFSPSCVWLHKGQKAKRANRVRAKDLRGSDVLCLLQRHQFYESQSADSTGSARAARLNVTHRQPRVADGYRTNVHGCLKRGEVKETGGEEWMTDAMVQTCPGDHT